MNYFSSDLHFGNDDSLKVDCRPFKNIKQFEKYVIKLWNKQTTKDDTIWVLGDFVDYHHNQNCEWERALRLVKKFKANVNLIIGNNEERLIKACFNEDYEKFKSYLLNLGFKSVEKEGYISICNQEFYLAHKPVDHHKEKLTLFGHSHRAMGVYKSFGFNLSCDINHFRLFSENDIQTLLYKKAKYWDDDENLKLV